jgi:hypothetical protein
MRKELKIRRQTSDARLQTFSSLGAELPSGDVFQNVFSKDINNTTSLTIPSPPSIQTIHQTVQYMAHPSSFLP